MASPETTSSAPETQTQYRQIADLIEASRRGLLAPMKLPPEVDLAAKYNVARQTIRRSLKLLERSGAVTRRRGRGTYLRPLQARAPLTPGTSIGFVPPWWALSSNAWYTATVFDGVCDWSERRELQQSVVRVERQGTDPHVLLERIAARKIKGLIWVHPTTEQIELLTTISRHLPCVVVGRDYVDTGLHTVLPAYEDAAMMIDQQLAAHGHPTYAVLSRHLEDPMAQTWLSGFRAAHLARGTRFDASQNFLDIGFYDRDRLAELLTDFYMPKHPDIRAFVVTSSSYLIPLLASDSFRARVPEEISLVAFDYGVQPMHTYWPGRTVSHVTCDWTAIGRKAMDVLCSLTDGQPVPRVQYSPVTLVSGQSIAAVIPTITPAKQPL